MANGIAQSAEYWDKRPEVEALRRKYQGIPAWQLKSRDPEAYRLLYLPC